MKLVGHILLVAAFVKLPNIWCKCGSRNVCYPYLHLGFVSLLYMKVLFLQVNGCKCWEYLPSELRQMIVFLPN